MLLLEVTQSAPTPKSDTEEYDGKGPADLAQMLGSAGDWESEYSASVGDVDGMPMGLWNADSDNA
jgi:hypothetical protein